VNALSAGGGGSAQKPSQPPKSNSSSASQKPVQAQPETTNSTPASAPSETAPAVSTATLLNDPGSEPSSNPAASQQLNKIQADTSVGLTTGTNEEGYSLFDLAQSQPDTTPTQNEPADHLVDDPIEQEQHTDLETPPGFEPGSEVPETPDLGSQQPVSSRQLPGGGTEETYEVDGVTYTQVQGEDGQVNTSYEIDGVNYSSTDQQDGSNTLLVSTSGDDGTFTRTVTTGADGELQTDQYHAAQAETDPETGEITLQSREESLNAEGIRTINETVTRPDGGRSELNRTEQADGRVEEVYHYNGEDGTVQRTTNTLPDGSGETRTEKTYTSDQPLEELTEGIAPAVPEHLDGVVPLPQDGRGDTSVHEVEVVSIDANGEERLEYSEESYSQSSSDVTLQGSQELGYHRPGDTFPQGILPDNDNSNVTQTVTRVQARDENGQLVESSGASQTVMLAGERHEALGGGEVNVTRTDSWSSTGESTTNFSQQGFKEGDLLATNRGSDDLGDYFNATVGGHRYSAGWPSSLSKSPFDHYNMKGGGEVEDWLGAGSNDPLNVGVTVSRDAEGNEIGEAVTYSTVGENGEGKTVTRSEADGSVGWTYSNFENGGQDFQRQTVFEGTDVSIFETHAVTGNGEFVSTSETTDGGQVIAESQASRTRLNEAQLQQYVADGQLTQEQYERMLEDGPPYFAEQYLDLAEPLTKDGELLTNEDGNPIQTGHNTTSLTLSNASGYNVSEQFRQELGPDGMPTNDSRLSTVTDPNEDPPVVGHIRQREYDSDTGEYRVTEDAQLSVRDDGRYFYNDEEIAQFDFGGADLSGLLRDNQTLDARTVLGVINKVVGAGEHHAPLSEVAGGRLNLNQNAARVARAADILGIGVGAAGLFQGVRQGDGRTIVQGVGDMIGGTDSLYAAAKGIPGVSNYRAMGWLSKAAKPLGIAGGVVGVGLGIYDAWTAQSGHDRAAGVLNATAGAVAIGSVFFGPPGMLIGGLLSGGLSVAALLVGRGDDHDTAPIDERLKP